MKLRSQISLDLVAQGYIRGSKEFKNAYNNEWGKRNREKKRIAWRRYYHKKMKDTQGEWGRSRIEDWRKSNPGDWKVISQRSSKNGVHKRFYNNHQTKLKRDKSEYGKRKRRENPFFGVKKLIQSKSIENLRSVIEKFGIIINELDRKS